MDLTIPTYDPATGDERGEPINTVVAQEMLDYLFRRRAMGRQPWLDDPERFERLRRDWRARLAAPDVPVPARKTWQEHAWTLRQGDGALPWEQVADAVGHPAIAVRSAVAAVERKKAQAA